MRDVQRQQQAVERDSDSISAQQRRFFDEISRKQHQVRAGPCNARAERPPMLAADAGEGRRCRAVQGDSRQGAAGAGVLMLGMCARVA